MEDKTLIGGLLGILGPLVGYMLKSWYDERAEVRRAKRAEQRAREILESDKGTNDVDQAVAQANLEAQFAKLADQARRVRDSFNPPYSNGHGKHDADVTPLEVKKDR